MSLVVNPTLRTLDIMFLDELFEMGSGFVLDFSDRTLALFFATDLNIDIYDPAYAKNGTSKAKRLRCFLQTVDNATAIRVLNALWEYREAIRLNKQADDKVANAQGRFFALITRLQGKSETMSPSQKPPVPAFDNVYIGQLKSELISLSSLEAHTRGYAFEKLLKRIFDAYGLSALEPFRLRGEQIDGSFQLNNDTYLLEAKWQNSPIGVAELHTFHGKIEQKASWTRGLFVSESGFSEEGLTAFGRGKRVICMDGFDLYETLNREIPLPKVLESKVRKAAETGSPFCRVRDLFPE